MVTEKKTISTEMRCRQCAYDLQKLTTPRCPECNRKFDPTNPSTVLTKPVSGRRQLIIAGIAALCLATPFLVIKIKDMNIPSLDWLSSPYLSFLLLPLLLGGWVVGWNGLRPSWAAMTGKSPWVTHHHAMVAAFWINAAIGVGFTGYLLLTFVMRVFFSG